MSDEARPPTLEQFLAAARAEFAFLAEYGFQEASAARSGYINRYAVLYKRGNWHVRIEGLSYGYSAGLSVVAPDGREATFGLAVPESFREAREGLGRGQLGDLKYCALCFRTFGTAFLGGDTSVFEELLRRRQLAVERDHAYWAQRDMDIAIGKAADAFRAKRYLDVVRLLSPFESRLPPAQAAKFQLAKKRCQ